MAKVGILNSGYGNINSLIRMLSKVGLDSVPVSTTSDLTNVHSIVIPGVGAFDFAMQRLNETGLANSLFCLAQSGYVPILGICLGMQILFSSSQEGKLPGLNILPGSVKHLRELSDTMMSPHVGWEYLTHPDLIANPSQRFYFSHSYYVDCPSSLISSSYSDSSISVPAIVSRGLVTGFQFHPEKSNLNGLYLLKAYYKNLGFL